MKLERQLEARIPKALIAGTNKPTKCAQGNSDGFEHWKLKFDGMETNKELGTTRNYSRIEHAYHLMAKEADLHPNIVKYLIDLFHSPKTNQKNAQLIFTTHDTSLLASDVFRRDQVWFIQKDSNQGSRLYSLLDFKPRKE